MSLYFSKEDVEAAKDPVNFKCEYIRKNVFDDCAHVGTIPTNHTLCSEMIAQLPDLTDLEVCILFNPELLVMIQALYPEALITMVTGSHKAASLNWENLDIVEVDPFDLDTFTTGDFKMKFDVVIGNPPYQDATAKSSKKLWPKFVDKSMVLLRDGGWLGMITPSSWMNGTSSVFRYFKEYQCTQLCTDGTAHFPTVGTTISYYTIQKTKNTKSTLVDNEYMVDFASIEMIPRSGPRMLDLFGKLLVCSTTLDVKFDSFCHSQRTDRVSSEQQGAFVFPNRHGANTIKYSNEMHPCFKHNKVMFYMSGNPKPIYDKGTAGVTQHHGYILANTNLLANNIVSYMTSNIIRFMIRESSFGQAWNKNILPKLPAVDFTRTWTDAELYKHFNLTQEEIDYIEENV